MLEVPTDLQQPALSMKHIYTDGGRKASGQIEKKDCTVRALAVARGISYNEAHQIMAAVGRKPWRGFKFYKAAEALKFVAHPQPDKGKGRLRVHTALEKYRTGRFVFRIEKHVFAVVDGVAYDNNAPETLRNCIVTDVWEVPQAYEQTTTALGV